MIMLRFKYLHIIHLGNTSLPWHNIDPKENHKQFIKDNEFSSSSGSVEHGWGFCHSLGVILKKIYIYNYYYFESQKILIDMFVHIQT